MSRADPPRAGLNGLGSLIELLSPVAAGPDRYLAPSRFGASSGRLFGGQLVAQALRAATLSVDAAYLPHSLHSYFVSTGHASRPVDLRVERVRTGRSFATRQVTASQQGVTIFVLAASFHVAEPGESYQVPMAVSVPPPESDEPWAPLMTGPISAEFELREFAPEPWQDDGAARAARRFWVRTRGRLPGDPGMHAAVFGYVSDFGATIAAHVPIGVPFGTGMHASLDHSVWFHRPVLMDEWVLIDYRPVSNSGARGLVLGTAYSIGGELLASTAQEVVIRSGAVR
jgi:acyl-CoA thioesterase II